MRISSLAVALFAIPMASLTADEQASIDRIERALDQETKFEFFEAPLQQVVDYIKDTHKIPIYFDVSTLEDLSIGTDTPVTQSLRGVTLRSALNLALPEVALDYAIVNEVLYLTSEEKATKLRRLVVYEIAATDKGLTSDQLVQLVNMLVFNEGKQKAEKEKQPKSAARHSIVVLPGRIVVNGNEHEHYRIRSLLTKLKVMTVKHRGRGEEIADSKTRRKNRVAKPAVAPGDPFGPPTRSKRRKRSAPSDDPFADDSKEPQPVKPSVRNDDPFGDSAPKRKAKPRNDKSDPFGR